MQELASGEFQRHVHGAPARGGDAVDGAPECGPAGVSQTGGPEPLGQRLWTGRGQLLQCPAGTGPEPQGTQRHQQRPGP